MLPGVGGVVDRYRVERLIGAGGLGEVWEVEHRVLGTRRALKVLRHGRGDLLAEGRVQARLHHDNVLPILDAFGGDNGIALVLPLVRGPSLAGLLRAYRPSVDEVKALALEICAGLCFAHERGIAHRDLKPANILLDPAGTRIVPRIADFGLAAAVGVTAGRGAGTPGYAAPEQLEGRPVDARADWWSFGIVLYELLVGHRPYERIRPRSGTDWVTAPPADWEPVLSRLLVVEPDQRLADPDAIIASVREVPGGGTEQPLALDGALAGAVQGVMRRRTDQELAEASDHTEQTVATLESVPDSRRDTPSFVTEPADHHNLPASRERLIGRQEDLRVLRARILGGGARVLTLTGPGGVGKTRLALELGHGLLTDFIGGVWLVDLSAARTVADVQISIAAALDLPLPDTPAERLANALRGRGPTVLLLDNAEVVLEPLRQAVDPLLDVARDLVVLVTSREPVRLRGESVYPIDVLGLPADPPEGSALEAAQQSEAVQLFVSRARSARADFTLDAHTAEAVCELVRLLDGLPLALELAAARVRVMAPNKLVQRMSRRFDLLVRRRGSDAPDRQRTLRACLEASWAALGDQEQALLAQLGAFAGSPALEDVEAVVLPPSDGSLVEDVLAELVDKSLVRVRHGGRVRFELLESIRAFAREKLPAFADPDVICLRHAQRVSRWGRARLREVLGGHGGVDKRLQLSADRQDLLLAAERALDWRKPELATPIAVAAWALLETTGPLDHAAGLLDRARALDPDDPELARCSGMALLRTGRREQAGTAFHEAMSGFQAVGDSIGLAECHNGLGLVHLGAGAIDQAQAAFERGRALARRAGNARIEGVLEANLVLVAWRRRDFAAAEVHARAALPLHQRAGDSRSLGRSLGNLAVLKHELGALAEADALYGQALQALHAVGDTREEGLFLGQRGLLRTELGNLDGAERALVRALRLVRRVGARGFEAANLGNLGVLFGLRDDWEAATRYHTDARELHLELGDLRSVMIDTANLGITALEHGQTAAAIAGLDEALERAEQTEDLRAQGAFLAARARVDLALNDLRAAGERLDRAEALLLDHGGQVERAKAATVRVAWLRARGRDEEARALLAEAEKTASEAGAGGRSPLGRALSRVGGKLR